MDEQVKEKETAKESSMLFWVKLQTCLTGAVLALLLIVGRHPLYSMSPKEWLR